MLTILADGKPASLVVDRGDGSNKTRTLDPDDVTLEVIWELEGTDRDDHPNICHRFSSEGVIVDARTDHEVNAISQSQWDQLASDGGLI